MMSPEESPQFDLPFSATDVSTTVLAEDGVAAEAGALAVTLAALEAEMRHRGAEPSRTIVLLPYTQLLEPARQAWSAQFHQGFPPRFETTRSWAMATGPHVASPTDWTGDAARDGLVAQSLLKQATQARLPGSMRSALIDRVLESARQLSTVAAARRPGERAEWADSHKALVSSSMQSLYWESLAATVALTWVGFSGFVTDWLWSAQAAPGTAADVLLVVPGLQMDPLTQALVGCWGERCAVMPPLEPGPGPASRKTQWRLMACAQADEEARQAAASAVSHINAGRTPVALVAQDRVLTRRVSALLSGLGARLRDETGWKLSTTHAAAQLMALLRASQPGAKVDDVLDFLKLCTADAPLLQAKVSDGEGVSVDEGGLEGLGESGDLGEAAGIVNLLELRARRFQLSRWASLVNHAEMQPYLPLRAVDLLAGLAPSRPLVDWLEALRDATEATGWSEEWAADAAGERLLATLRLAPDGAQEWRQLLGDALLPQRMSLGGFTSWVRQTLESATFMPGDDRQADVVVLPMAQLPGRTFAACVMAGCDESHLSASPDPTGTWSQEQRAALGLPGRAELAEQAREAWRHVLGQPWLDVLWRRAEGAEHLNPAAWVQDLMAADAPSTEARACVQREVPGDRVEHMPAPSAVGLRVPQVSSTHYQDLRDCPYRYYAMRLLGLQPVEELEQAPGKREWGTVLHAVLRRFHEERRDGLLIRADEPGRLDALLHEEMLRVGLVVDGHAGEFHPFVAAWPKVRDGYLDWLYRPLSDGGGAELVFQRGEARLRGKVGPYDMMGDIDRIDSGPGGATWVIDYKTGSLQGLREKVADPMEDTQTAFYAALLGGEADVRAAYLGVSDSKPEGAKKQPTTLVEQTEVMAVREALVAGIVSDLSRIEGGHPLKAMGEGSVCDYCQARGLCRRDFWEQTA